MTTLVATVEPAQQRVRLDVAAAPTTVEIWRVDGAGNQTPVRNAEPLTTSAGTGLVYDYELPRDTAVTYRTTDGAVTSSVSLDSNGQVWLVHPGQPSLSMAVHVVSLPAKRRDMGTVTYEPVGRSGAVSVSVGLSQAWSGTLTLATVSTDEYRGMLDLIGDGQPLLFAPPPTMDDTAYVAVVGSPDEQRVTDLPADDTRLWSLDVVRVGRPAGQGAAEWRWADVLATYPSWAALQAAESTWLDVLDGPG